jgi:hypothetical protein
MVRALGLEPRTNALKGRFHRFAVSGKDLQFVYKTNIYSCLVCEREINELQRIAIDIKKKYHKSIT